MSSSDAITSLLVVSTPVISDVEDSIVSAVPPTSDRQRPVREYLPAQEMISVGVVANGAAVAWGECCAWPIGSQGSPTDMSRNDIVRIVQELIDPALRGISLSRFRYLAQRLDDLRKTVTLTREVDIPPESAEPRKVSRRAFLTGQLASPSRFSSVEQVDVELPLNAALRYSVSQALLGAVAQAQGLTMVEVIAKEYALGDAAVAVPLQVAADEIALGRDFSRRVRSLGYASTGSSPKETLGDNAELLQRWTRRMQQQIASSKTEELAALHLDVRGGLGDIYGQNLGKILGALYGLEQAARPYQVRVIDPVCLEERPAQLENMRLLKEYVRLRGLKLKLVARAWVETLDDVQAFLEADAADMLMLEMFRLGSLHQSIEAVLACQRQGVGVLLAGHPQDRDQGLRIASQLALAVKPDFLIVPAGANNLSFVLSESDRILAWLGHKRASGVAA